MGGAGGAAAPPIIETVRVLRGVSAPPKILALRVLHPQYFNHNYLADFHCCIMASLCSIDPIVVVVAAQTQFRKKFLQLA